MKRSHLTGASRRYYLKHYTLISVAGFVCAAVICADFLAGHSVQKSIETHNLAKIGRTTHVLEAAVPFIDDLDSRLRAAGTVRDAACWLELPLISAQANTSLRRGGMVTGIDGEFSAFFRDMKPPAAPAQGEIWLNKKNADELGCRPGQRITLRIRKSATGYVRNPAARDTANFSDEVFTLTRILPDSGMGRFQIEITQRAPSCYFINAAQLARLAGIPGRSNRMLIETDEEQFTLPRELLFPEDGGITIEENETHTVLRSSSYFIEPGAAASVRAAFPDAEFVYASFLKSATYQDRARHYLFFVTSSKDRGVSISPQLAGHTGARAGSTMYLQYYTFSEDDASLSESSVQIRVDRIISDEVLAARRGEIPDFPGLDEGRSCSEWESSLPIDLSHIDKEMEDDWKRYGRRPLLILDEKNARTISPDPALIRLPAASAARLRGILRRNPGSTFIGAHSRALRRELTEASGASVDFRALFIAMSVFLVMAVLFVHAIAALRFLDARRREAAVLRSAGFGSTVLEKLYLREMLPFLLLPCAAGSLAGAALVHLLIRALRGVWYGIVHTDALSLYISPTAFIYAFAIAAVPLLVLSHAIIALRLRRMSAGEIALPVPGPGRAEKRVFLALSAAACTLALLFFFAARRFASYQIALCFVSGFFTLTALLCALHTRSRGCLLRERAIIAVTALSLYLVAGVSAHRRTIAFDPASSSAPLGGRAYVIETALPVAPDQLPYTGDDKEPVTFSLYGRERANCLNLNEIRKPAIAGVDTKFMDRKRIFTLRDARGREIYWTVLGEVLDDGSVPVAVDSSVLQWSLKKRIGDTLRYEAPDGRELTLTIVASVNNTVVQGVLYAERSLLHRLLGADTGARIILAGSREDTAFAQTLARRFAQWGGEVRAAREEIQLFMELENTYLRIFQTISIIAFIPGFAGLALLSSGTKRGRDSRYFLMRALGYSQIALRKRHLRRYRSLLGCAAACSALALLPALYPLISGGYVLELARNLGLIFATALLAGNALIALLPREKD